MKIKTIAILGILFFCAQSIVAQQVTPIDYKAIAAEKVKELKTGTLIVRLPSSAKKLKELGKQIDALNAKNKDATRLTEMYNSTLAETRAFNQRLITAFEEEYQFSNFLFLHDTASIALKNGVREGIFLDKFGKLDPTIQLQTNDWLLGAVEYTGFPLDLAFERLTVQTKAGKKLEMPFPKADKSAFWIKLGSSDEQDMHKMKKAIERFNKRLFKAYEG